MDKIHQDLYVHYQHDYYLYGLASSKAGYKLAWLLNRALRWKLKRAEDLRLDFPDDPSLLISNFIFTTAHRTFRLLRNQAFTADETTTFLLPELKQWDFLLHIQDPSTTFDHDHFLREVRRLEDVQRAERIEIDSVEHKENLLF